MTTREFIKWIFDNGVSMDAELFIESHSSKNGWNIELNGVKYDGTEITIELDKLEDGYYEE